VSADALDDFLPTHDSGCTVWPRPCRRQETVGQHIQPLGRINGLELGAEVVFASRSRITQRLEIGSGEHSPRPAPAEEAQRSMRSP
jgi:hypothetical protein